MTSVALDPTGRLVAAGAGRRSLSTTRTPASAAHCFTGHTDAVTGLAFSRDGSQLASSSRDHDARIWDAKRFGSSSSCGGTPPSVSGVAFSSDGRWVATAGATKAGVWATHATDLPGDFMFFVRGNQPPINAVAFSPHGWELASASRDGSIRVFDCQLCGRLANLESYAKAQLSSLKRAR